MGRPLWRVPFCSARDLLAKFKSSGHVSELGWQNPVDKLEFCRRFATSSDSSHALWGYESSKSIQRQIVDALCRGKRSRASTLLLDLGHGTPSLRVQDFVDVLNYCATSPDPLFVMEAWKIMEEKKTGLDDISCMLIMEALCKGGYLQEASNWINYIGESQGFYPTLPVYNTFLEACSKMKCVTLANQWLDLMEQRLVGKDETTYSVLLKLAVYQKDLPAVHHIWKDYVKHYNPTLTFLQKFIKSFAILSDLESANEALQRMVVLASQRKIYVGASDKGQLHSSRLDIPILMNGELSLQKFDLKGIEQSVSLHADNCTSHLQQFPMFAIGNREDERDKIAGSFKYISVYMKRALKWSFNDVIYACAKARNSGLAEQLMLQMQNLGVQPTSDTYNGFIKAVVSERDFSEGMKVLNTMRQNCLKPFDATLATLSVAASRALELHVAEFLLNQISNCIYPYPYNSLLAAYDKIDQPERAVQVLAKMKQLNTRLDVHTYEHLFSLFGNVNAPYEDGNMLSGMSCAKRISAIDMDMAKNGVQHSPLSMKFLLKALGVEGMIQELMRYLHKAEDLFFRNNIELELSIYNRLLDSLVSAKESRLAIKVFKHLKSSGLTLDAGTFDIMIHCCAIIPCYKSACALLSMMLRSGFYLETVTYTGLIKIKLEHRNFDDALNLLDKMSSEDIQVDIGVYNTILRTARWKGRIDIIELILGQMHQAKIRPDPATCYYVFSAYVGRGFHNTAIEALQVLTMRMICQEETAVQEVKEKFEEDFIFNEDAEADLPIPELFEESEELAFSLLSLRWCAILGFPISWSPEESQWERRLSANYDRRQNALIGACS